jgi:hypothetical protein
MGEEIQRKRVWDPQPRQAQALSCPADELFFGGAKGGGKSDFLLGDYLADYEEWGEAWKGILFRRSYKELDEIIGRSKQVIGQIPGAHYTSGEAMLWKIPAPRAKYPGFATLRFRSLDSDLRVGEYNGHQYPWIGWDELTEFPGSGPYIFIVGCSRSAFGAPTRIRSTGNPGRPGHIWVKARFIDVAEPFHIYKDPDTNLTRCFIPSRLEDNLILMKNDPKYEQKLMLYPPHLRKALRYGLWDVVVGQVFEEFSHDKHTIAPTPLDSSWYRFVAMDWGYKKPFAVQWWAVNTDGRMILYKQWYGCETGAENTGLQMSAGAVAAKAWEMSVNEGATTMVADPACWTKIGLSDQKGVEVPSVAETFENVGFTMVRANNDRLNGLLRVHELLQATTPDGHSMLLITRTCHHWLRTVPYLTSDPRNPEDIDTNLEDHDYDCTRYAVMSEYALDPRGLARRPVLQILKRKKEYDPLREGL